jgi:regulator of protease activity HflC (stomatin/prohibitin superfamily)
MPLAVIVVQLVLFIMAAPAWAQERGYLGVFIQNLPRTFEAGGTSIREGVVILGLIRHGPGEAGGLQRGDILLKLNDQPVRRVEDVQRLVAEVAVGDVIQVEIFRRNQVLRLPVKIDAAPQPPSPPPLDISPILLEQEKTIWIIVGGALLSLLLVYLASAQPWLRWPRTRTAAMFAQARQIRISTYKAMLAVVGLLVVGVICFSVTLIEVGHRGVVFHLFSGVQSEILGEGVHMLLPVLHRVSVYDTRSRLYHIQSLDASPPRGAAPSQDHLLWTPTADGLKVGLDLSVRYRLDPARLAELHRAVGPEFEVKIVHPIVWNVMRLVASEYSLLDIYGRRRHDMQQQALMRVQSLFARDGLFAEDLLLRDVVYPKEFEKTLVAKMVAEQKVQESVFEVQQAALRAQAQVLEAQGEAQALELVNQAIRDQPLLLQYLWIRSLPERVKIIVVPNRAGKPTPLLHPHPPDTQHALTPPGGDG